MKQDNARLKYIGLTNTNNQGYQMTIIDYIKSDDIVVQFNDKYQTIKHCRASNFKKGIVSNPNHPTVYGFGIIDVERHNLAKEKEYIMWTHMIQRCYVTDTNRREKDLAYNDCVVCEGWRKYSVFYEWVHSQENYCKWLNGGFSIDKDIIQKGNRIYCPNYCCLVPNYINNIFTKHDIQRGDFPIGVTKHKDQFRARCNNPLLNTSKHIGVYNTIEEAFYAYKNYKENLIKEVATIEYEKKNITQKCYESMMNYNVEITD